MWAESEYAKLPAYDLDTPNQPHQAFFCHQQDGRLCAGWIGTHDMDNSLALRLAVLFRTITPDEADRAREYTTDVPLWDSGAQAAEHGIEWIAAPDVDAERIIAKLNRKRES